MRGIIFNATIPRYVLSKALGRFNKAFYYSPVSSIGLGDFPEPVLLGEDWVKIKTILGGVCGSDINMITLHDSPSTSPFVSFPFVIGHENLGVIVQKGEAVTKFSIGDRVTANPLLSCRVRGVEACPACLRGDYSLCSNITKGAIAPGISIGFCRSTGGSWGEYYIAHESQLHKVHDSISDEEAVLIDPLCSALHPVMRNFPGDHERILVVGAGIIGLFVTACMRVLGSKAEITMLVKHGFQGEKAKEFGADHIVYLKEDYYKRFGEITGGELYQPMIGKKVMMGGFDKVFDCVGSASAIEESLKFTRAGGIVILVGLAGMIQNIDLTPVWFKEISLRGTMYYNDETSREGERLDAYQIGLDIMSQGLLQLDGIVTHKYRIGQYGKALDTIIHKRDSRCLKTVFEF